MSDFSNLFAMLEERLLRKIKVFILRSVWQPLMAMTQLLFRSIEPGNIRLKSVGRESPIRQFAIAPRVHPVICHRSPRLSSLQLNSWNPKKPFMSS